MLGMARNAFAGALSRDPTRRRPGLMNLFTYGRRVTLTMQTMRDTDEAFATWWSAYHDKLSRDPLMKYFDDPSNATLKRAVSAQDLPPWLTVPTAR